jgi:hypothetical protein
MERKQAMNKKVKNVVPLQLDKEFCNMILDSVEFKEQRGLRAVSLRTILDFYIAEKMKVKGTTKRNLQ